MTVNKQVEDFCLSYKTFWSLKLLCLEHISPSETFLLSMDSGRIEAQMHVLDQTIASNDKDVSLHPVA